MDTYNLINSKAISEHCRKIKHQFNTEEIAVLIYRNKTMSVDEKIVAYKELINDYPDMKVTKRRNYKHYDSVKDMIQKEIQRLETETKILLEDEEDVVYSYNYLCDTRNRGFIEGKNEFRDVYKTFKEVQGLIEQEIIDDEEREIVSFVITKRTVSKQNKYMIKAEYMIDKNRELKMVNIYNFESGWLDISNICLNIPTPFKKGDLLIANSTSPFSEGYVLSYEKFPFVLEYLITWDDNFKKALDKGSYDSSDMQGPGYLISKAGNLYVDNVFDYDSWEYYDENIHGKLKGMDRLLYAVSSLIQGKISIDLFIDAYEVMKYEKAKNNMVIYTNEGLKLAGLENLVEEQ